LFSGSGKLTWTSYCATQPSGLGVEKLIGLIVKVSSENDFPQIKTKENIMKKRVWIKL
jgi:hypothetical protein